jgi:ACS family sodium-dependent inorganic phosphate cotransporter
MAEEFGYSESTKGVINSVFSLGYMAALLPAGLLGSFASPKLVMACGAAIWSVAQIAVPAAAHANLLALYMCRFLMGSAEAVAIPTIQTFVARFVPPSQRSLVIAFLLSGLQVGDVAAYTLSPTLISVLGWEGLFYVYGLLGFAWLGLWLVSVDRSTSVLSSNNILLDVQHYIRT